MSKSHDIAAYAARMHANDTAVRSLDIAIDVHSEGKAEASVTVTDDMLNGFSVCHGGYLFTLADTAFAYACNTYGNVTVAAGASIDFLKPVKLGDRLTATAVERSRGGRTGVYDVTVVTQEGETVALFRGRSHSTRREILDAD